MLEEVPRRGWERSSQSLRATRILDPSSFGARRFAVDQERAEEFRNDSPRGAKPLPRPTSEDLGRRVLPRLGHAGPFLSDPLCSLLGASVGVVEFSGPEPDRKAWVWGCACLPGSLKRWRVWDVQSLKRIEVPGPVNGYTDIHFAAKQKLL